MEILQTKRFERFGNDCLINVEVSLVKIFDTYNIYKHTKYHGSWVPKEITEECYNFINKDQAELAYEHLITTMNK